MIFKINNLIQVGLRKFLSYTWRVMIVSIVYAKILIIGEHPTRSGAFGEHPAFSQPEGWGKSISPGFSRGSSCTPVGRALAQTVKNQLAIQKTIL
jgi:hypothetical protein